MKIAVLIARILLGLMFLVFGSNDFLHFIPMQPPPGDAGTYLGILVSHNVMSFVGLLMVIAGLLLLVGRFVPLALVILGPILVNILLNPALIDPASGVKAASTGRTHARISAAILLRQTRCIQRAVHTLKLLSVSIAKRRYIVADAFDLRYVKLNFCSARTT